MNGAADLAGAREPRWSPAAIHGEAERSEGTSVFRAPFRVGWWWWWRSASTTSTASFAPADGGSVVADFVGESCSDQIEEGVMLLVAREGNERGLGAGDGLTGANRGGDRGGSGRPELRGKTSSGSP